MEVTSMRNCRILVVATMLGLSANAMSQDVGSAQSKLLARRAAEADCYRKLAETVYGVKLNSDTYVRDFVTESDQIRTSVDTFVKGIRLGKPRYYEDGMCEVDAEVTVAKLVTEIKRWHHDHYRGSRVTTTDIERVRKYFKKDVIRVTGAGAPRAELPRDLPEGVEDVITQLPSDYVLTPSLPRIWSSVSPQARLMAQRAARIDAQRNLLEQIKGLRLTSDTLVRDFVTESDEITARADGLVVGAQEAGRYYHADELIVEVTMEVPVEKVITRIKELHEEHYHGRRVTTVDITNVKKTIKREMIRATGAGVPPARFLKRIQIAGIVMPDWAGQRIQSTGEGVFDAAGGAQQKLKAARAARVDAMRKLAEQVYGLTVRSNTTVRDFVAEMDEITSQVDAVLSGAIAGDPAFQDGIATVTVSIPASKIWSVVHQQILIVDRRG